MIPLGLEPRTLSLKVRCSNQLSYGIGGAKNAGSATPFVICGCKGMHLAANDATRMRKNVRFGVLAGAVALMLNSEAVVAQTQPPAKRPLAMADSLLTQAEYAAAATVLDSVAARRPTPAVLLRLAFAREQEGRAPDALWALRRAYELRPDRAVLRKMDALASAHHLGGYEYGDRYFFLTVFRRYYQSLLEAALFAGVLGATLLLLRRRRYPTARPWAGALLAYVGLTAVGLNVLRPERLGREVIVRQPTPLMSGPTAGGRWLATLPAGQQLPVAGTRQDIWLPVRWQGVRAWVRAGALYGGAAYRVASDEDVSDD